MVLTSGPCFQSHLWHVSLNSKKRWATHVFFSLIVFLTLASSLEARASDAGALTQEPAEEVKSLKPHPRLDASPNATDKRLKLNKTLSPIFDPNALVIEGQQKLFSIESKLLSELSGAVRANGEGWWVANDGGHQAEVYRISEDGQVTHQLKLPGVRNLDWEDLAAFEWEGRRFLLIADTGDNDAIRPEVGLWILPEPNLAALSEIKTTPISITPRLLRYIRLSYPDGARDVEAVSVDHQAGQVIFLSKRDTQAHLYVLPVSAMMQPDARKISHQRLTPIYLTTASGMAKSFYVPALANLLKWVVTRPTALSSVVLPDGKTTRYAVLTYSYLYLFHRDENESIQLAFERPARVIRLSPGGLPQAEAVALSADGSQVTVFSEGLGSAVHRWSFK